MVSRVSDLGQITIDSDARAQLRVEPGMIAFQRVVNGRLEIVFLPAPHRQSLFGVFRDAAKRAGILTSDDPENAVMEAVTEEQSMTDPDGP